MAAARRGGRFHRGAHVPVPEIDTADGERVTATDGHPFWVDDDGQAATPGGRWIDAVELRQGQWLKTSDGRLVKVAGVHAHPQHATVYNLTIANLHTYHVLAGDEPVLVHNCRTLYHYTDLKGHDGILESQELWPSLKANNPRDARYGDGQYFTDVQPVKNISARLARLLMRNPLAKGRLTHYVEIDVTGLDVRKGRSGVFYILNDGPLDVTGRIVRSGRI
ncbi:HYD1 signature containing ADP-ribosyltransferase family protein [Micromonospora zhanjiangensis]|uniref:HYD1 signature containing ADP-ribosyltransferase family protein n=1 Tax=Micromonospora zhanjiangensis TaxID=1522057 RepID=A0ABV8KHY5_9ACTN